MNKWGKKAYIVAADYIINGQIIRPMGGAFSCARTAAKDAGRWSSSPLDVTQIWFRQSNKIQGQAKPDLRVLGPRGPRACVVLTASTRRRA